MYQHLRVAIVVMFFVLASTWIDTASATLITIHPGTNLFNFDLSGQSPAPPYDQTFTNFEFQPGGAGIFENPTIYEDFGGLGASASSLVTQNIPTGTFTASVISSSIGILDGTYSGSFNWTGPDRLVEINAQGLKAGSFTAPVGPVVPVPEPLSLSLMFFGLSALGLRRRLRARQD